MQLIYRHDGLALRRSDMSKPLLRAFSGHEQVRIVLNTSGQDPEECESSGERVRGGFENKCGDRLRIVAFAFDLAAVQLEFGGGPV